MTDLLFNPLHGQCPYKVKTLIIDSSKRDRDAYPDPCSFRLKLVEPIRSVAAIRILRTEFTKSTEEENLFVVNEFEMPLVTSDMEPAYVYINGWTNCVIAAKDDTEQSLPVALRVVVGDDQFSSITMPIQADPFMIHFRPVEPRVNSLEVRIYKQDGTPYPIHDVRLVMTFAVYQLC